MSTIINTKTLGPETSSATASIGDFVPSKSHKRAGGGSLRALNAKADRDPARLMRIATANARRLLGKPTL